MTTPQGSFWQSDPEYHGVILEAGSLRLAVSPNGKRYMLQECVSGVCRLLHHRKRLSDLLPVLPEQIASKLKGVPDNPLQYPRFWAGDMAAQGLRVRCANNERDEYSGVIASQGDFRLSVLSPRPRFALQQRDASGVWRNVVTSVRKAPIQDVLLSNLHPSHRAAMFCHKPGLMSAVVRLPEYASSYSGRRPEALSQAVRLPRKGDKRPASKKRLLPVPEKRSGSDR